MCIAVPATLRKSVAYQAFSVSCDFLFFRMNFVYCVLLTAVLVPSIKCQYIGDHNDTDSVKPAKICFDDPKNCTRCDIYAECTTFSTQVVPKALNSTITKHLSVTYLGAEVELTPDMFANLPYLEELSIYDTFKVVALRPGTFADLPLLTSLFLEKTKISSLPSYLFHPENELLRLTIRSSHLVEIPGNIFHALPNLTLANFEFNNIIHNNCSSIGESFRSLKCLQHLNLANISIGEQCLNAICASFFSPIETSVQFLNLTNTNLFGSSPNLFGNFKDLQELDISIAEGYSDCPSAAADLFWNLPQSLEVLFMRRWRSAAAVSPDCVLNETSIAGLKNLTNLKHLDVKWSDMLFGEALRASVFAGFTSLKRLELGWCRFSQVEDFVFDDCPLLNYVSLNGNPFGARPINLYSDSGHANLVSLGLKGASVYSDFDVSYIPLEILRRSPVWELNLDDNYIRRMPIFASPEFPEATENLTFIHLDMNYLKNFYWDDEINFGNHCHLMPKLRKLSVRENRLENIEGLCISITHLDLSGNDIECVKYWPSNERHIKSLQNLKVLILSKNFIDKFSDDTFSLMMNLTEIYLDDNNLTSVSEDIFHHNSDLQVIDLRHNLIRAFTLRHFEHLKKLRKLDLQDNQITTLDEHMIDYIQDSLSIDEFGIIDNPLTCFCTQDHVQRFIQKTTKVPRAWEVICAGPTSLLRGQPVYSYERDTFYCDHRENVIIAFSVLSGFVVTLFVALPCYKYRWYLSHLRIVLAAIIRQAGAVKFEHQCLYDALVLYDKESNTDTDWVAECLFPNTEDYTEPDAKV